MVFYLFLLLGDLSLSFGSVFNGLLAYELRACDGMGGVLEQFADHKVCLVEPSCAGFELAFAAAAAD